jgi:hypothetical protein
MWRALADVADGLGLDRARMEALAARAVSQQTELEGQRVGVARRALTAV